jgi:hypothetical protein
MKLRLLIWALLGFGLTGSVLAGAGEWINRLFRYGAIDLIAADPRDPLTVYASGCGRSTPETWPSCGTFKSVDGGATWTRILDQDATALAIYPGDSSVVYAGDWGAGVLRSVDAGASWSLLNSGISCVFVRSVAVDPVNSSTVLAGSSNIGHSSEQCGGLFRSLDAGTTWQLLSRFIWPQQLAFDPGNGSRVLALDYVGEGCCSLEISTDGGTTWREPSGGPFGATVLVTDPRVSPRVYAVGAGVYMSADGGEHWQMTSLSVFSVTSLAVDPTNPEIIYAGTTNLGNGWIPAGVFRSVNGGQSWSQMNTGLTDSEVLSVGVNATGTRVYAGTRAGGLFVYDLGRPEPLIGRSRPTVRRIAPRGLRSETGR